MFRLVASLAIFAIASAQDTHYCPDGWVVSQTGGNVECILLGGLEERVTKADAELICAGHGGWLVDMDEESEHHHGSKNRFIKGLISDAVGQGNIGIPGYKYDDQWWIGAECNGPHNENNWGNWVWDHSNTSVTWFDWMNGEPNNWHQQRCLTYLKDQDIFGFGVYHWNDWGCDYNARFICERAPFTV